MIQVRFSVKNNELKRLPSPVYFFINGKSPLLSDAKIVWLEV